MSLRIRTLVCLSVISIPNAVGAQTISFASPLAYDSASAPYSVAIGDVNGDGKPDLVVANTGVMPNGLPPPQGDGINVLLGVGNGQFAPAVHFNAGSSPAGVAIADFNNDGWADLAVANGNSSSVSILLGNGQPTLFNPPTDFAVGSSPEAIATGDFNEDGNLDLALPTNGNPARVSTLLGAGNGSFGSLTHYPVGFHTVSVAIADFDGDGHQDLAVANESSAPPNTVSILLGNGGGTFGAATDINAGTQPLDLAVGDFNQDGLPDLAVSTGVATVSVLLATGGGSFAAPLELFIPFGGAAVSIAVADLNGDCTQDIIVALSSSSVYAFAGTGTGAFDSGAFFDAGTSFISSIAVGDLNGDGQPDAVVTNRSIDKVSVLLNIGAVFAPSSLAPKNLSMNAGASRFPDTVVSGCHVYVVWEDYTNSPTLPEIMLARSSDRGVTYSAPMNISSDPGSSIGPRVAVSDNHVYVMWIRPFDGEILLKASHDHGATFGAEVNVSNTPGSSENPTIAASGNNVYVAWREWVSGGNTEIYYARSTNAGGGFPAAVNLSNTPLSSATPALVAEGPKVYVAWQDDQPNSEIFVRASDTFGAGFAPTVNVSNDAGSSQIPALAASGNLAYVVWNDSLAGNTEVLLRPIVYDGVSFTIGGTSNLSSNPGPSEFPQVAAAGDHAYVAWQDNDTGNYDILFRRISYDGATFSVDPTTTNVSANPADSKFQRIAATGNSVYVVWLDVFNAKFEVFLGASNDNGATFGTTGILSQNGQSSFEIAVAAADGSAFVAWRGNVGGNAEIFARTTTTVVSAGAATGAGTVTFATSAGGFTSMTSVAESSLPAAGKPAGVSFPFGFFNWTIANLAPGATVVVTVTYPSNVPLGAQYWKVIGGAWVNASSIVGDDDGDNVLTLTITDGQFGDADGIVNGQISDPGGIGAGAQLVVIDLRPGGAGNQINPKSRGRLRVAVMTTAAFNAATVDVSSIRFGANGTEAPASHPKLNDVDGDGDLDLVLQFDTESTGIVCGTTMARLTGVTSGGLAIQGLTTVRTVGCK